MTGRVFCILIKMLINTCSMIMLLGLDISILLICKFFVRELKEIVSVQGITRGRAETSFPNKLGFHCDF